MKAVQINSYGSSDVLEIKEVALPEPQPNQVLVQVCAAAINPFDTHLLAGMLKDRIPLQFPVTLGADFAGRITKTGADVTDLKVGDDAYGSALVLSGGSGAFAEAALIKQTNTAPMPKSVTYEEAAASVLVGVSALQALEEHMELASGQKILIHGGAGGIGHLAIQLAKSSGAYVATTVGRDDVEFVRSLGADKAIDYETEEFASIATGFDAVFDLVGGEVTDKSFTSLKKGGILVSMKGQPNEDLAKKHGVRAIGQWSKTNTKHLSRLTDLINSGKIKVHIDRVFPLDRIKEAIDHQNKGHPRGKVVVRMAGEPH
jgi:alcohol dehydrogenase